MRFLKLKDQSSSKQNVLKIERKIFVTMMVQPKYFRRDIVPKFHATTKPILHINADSFNNH